MQVDQTNILNNIKQNKIDGGSSILDFLKEEPKGMRKIMGEHYTRTQRPSKSGAIDMSKATYLRPDQKDEKKTKAEEILSNQGMSAEQRRNEMAVLANTMTPEDLQKMEEDGFSLSNMRGSTIVTVTDKIKIAMARGGAEASYGDSISKEALEKVTGSTAVAMQIAEVLESQDLPVTTDNLEETKNALAKAAEINELGESAIRYLVKNELQPTIENIYRASHSFVERSDVKNITSLAEEDFAAVKAQIDQVIEAAGYTVYDEIEADCKYLIENQISLTAENLNYYEDLKAFNQDKLENMELLYAVTEAIDDGKRPLDAMFLKGYTKWDQANEAQSVLENATDEDLAFLIDHEKELTIDNLRNASAYRDGKKAESDSLQFISAKRQLEEARLALTAQANYALLKKGISIDTKPLSELVDALKQQENDYYKNMLGDFEVEPTHEKISAYMRTEVVLAELKAYPATILSVDKLPDSLQALYDAGAVQKEAYEKARQSYEALWTAPRVDMGDSIKKAFRNVDDILKDLGYEPTESNRRAVRILAYNKTELTPENIDLIKAKDEQVQRTFSNMTPRVTLEMIRKNINPLDMELSQLNEAAEEIKQELGDNENERFEKYLWKLEQNKQISMEERSSYIGIYRLIAQVEKTDGAAIGALINQGTELTMKNLLSAVRSERKKTMDYQVSEEFEGVTAEHKTMQIDQQIKAAFVHNCAKDVAESLTPENVSKLLENGQDWQNLTPEQLKEEMQKLNEELQEKEKQLDEAFYKEQLLEFSEILSTSEDIYTYLEQNDIPNTASNILAINQMIKNPSRVFEKLFSTYGNSEDNIEKIETLKNKILEKFGEAIKTPEEMAKAQETLADVAEHAMDTMIIENEHISAIDLRELRLLNKQLTLCAKQSRQECYMIPIQTGEGVEGISVKIIRGEETKGLVDLLFRGSLMGKIAASFEAKEYGISGMIAAEDEETRQLLSDHLGMLAEKLNADGSEQIDLRVAYIPDLSLEHYATRHQATDNQSTQEKNPVQTKRLYQIAEGFIRTLEELDGADGIF